MSIMKYVITLILCLLLFAQCKRSEVAIYPTGIYDTLGVQWMTIDRDNITYYFQGTGTKAASIYTDMHEDAYIQIAPLFNPVLPRKLRYFVWTDWNQAQTIFNTPIDIAGFALSTECVCHVQADIPVGHEIVHVLSYWAKGVEPSTYSRFLNEGIAVAFDQVGDDKLETAKDALGRTSYSLSTVTDIWQEGSQESTPSEVLYPVGGAFVEYMYKNSTSEQFFALIKNQTRADAEEIYGKDKLDALIKEFDSQLGL